MSPDGLVTTMSRPSSWLATIGVGLAGALLGYPIFTVLLGFGDTDIVDRGGFLSALIGAFVVVPLAGLMMKRANAERHPRDRP